MRLNLSPRRPHPRRIDASVGVYWRAPVTQRPRLPVRSLDNDKWANMKELDELVELMRRLRSPAGCPWDQEQTHQTMTGHLLEEAYELVEALEAGGPKAICEELGDLLLQIVFHAQLAAERGNFDIADVCRGIVNKLVHRHPHVFGDVQVSGSEEVLHNWDLLKHQEHEAEPRASALDGVPQALPALQPAEKLQKRASQVGFDWGEVSGPRRKLDEELCELDQARESGDRDQIRAEVGDILTSVVNLCRFLSVDPEQALRQANRRFEERFGQMEAEAETQGRSLADMTLEEMEACWEAAKAVEHHED